MTARLLTFGPQRSLAWEAATDQVAWVHAGPPPLPNLAEHTREVLQNPLEFPPLAQALVPGDRIVVPLERHLPGATTIVAELWQVFEGCGVSPSDVTLLLPGSFRAQSGHDPRAGLPPAVGAEMALRTHDPTQADATGYLASSAAGERVYLARALLDADFVLPIGRVAFDPLLGYRGPASLLYPGLSTTDAFTRAHGQGQSELRPEDERPLRQLIEEISWLLGIQFGVQVLPSVNGEVAQVQAGQLEALARIGRSQLDRDWRITRHDRAATLVVTVSSGNEPASWQALGDALDVARTLVTRGGRIVALTSLNAAPEAGIELLRQCENPKAALQPLRQSSPPDLIAATQFAQAADWARIYLRSDLDPTLVEELFCVPLGSDREVERLLSDVQHAGVINSAQFAYGEIA